MSHEKVIGWHGTTTKQAEKIKKVGFNFNEYEFDVDNQRLPNDLGAGVYFFVEKEFLENPKHLAKRYVEIYKDNILKREKSSPIVLQAVIKFDEDNCLDFDNQDNFEDMITLKKTLKRELYDEVNRFTSGGIVNRGNFDGLLIEAMIKKFFKKGIIINIVSKSTFTNIEDSFGKHKIRHSNFPNGKEIAVRDVNLIEDIN